MLRTLMLKFMQERCPSNLHAQTAPCRLGVTGLPAEQQGILWQLCVRLTWWLGAEVDRCCACQLDNASKVLWLGCVSALAGLHK